MVDKVNRRGIVIAIIAPMIIALFLIRYAELETPSLGPRSYKG
jgi:hypothetical protein